MDKRKVVIVDAFRTPFDKFGGIMKDVPSSHLGAFVIRRMMERNKLAPDAVEELYYGACIPAETALSTNVVARQAVLLSGLSEKTRSVTVDRACCSSMVAVQMALRSIQHGEADVCIAMGTENMSRAAYLVSDARWGKRLGHITMQDPLFELGYAGWAPAALDAGEVALEDGVTREEQDQWAYLSQQRYKAALDAGRYKDEIEPFPVQVKKETVLMTEDASPRPDTALEKLAGLKPIYGSPTVTAGNAPGMNAGASCILMMTPEKAEAMGFTPLATVADACSIAGPARDLARVAGEAIKEMMRRNSLSLDEIDLIEINEAFAAVTLTSTKLLSDGDAALWETLKQKTNVNGGAIALGHPPGATGARLVTTMLYELRRRGGGTGIAAICGGLAQGDCVMIQV